MKRITNNLKLMLLLLISSVASGQTARLQVIHNSADAAAEFVDVYLNGTLLLDNFKFRTATPFIDAPAGVPVRIDVAPSLSTSAAESIYDATVTLTANQTYVVVADGIVSPTGYTPNQDFGLAIYAQGREAATNASNTDVLVHHGATDAPTVDVVETSIPAGTIVNDLAYTDFSSSYLELPTANYTLDVRDASGTVTVATYSAPLATLALQGKALTVVASGFLNPANNSEGPAFGLWVALPTGGDLVALPLVTPTARLQVIHNSADAAAEFVDVYLNGTLLLDNFKFRTATPFIDAPAGVPIRIDVAPSLSTSAAESIYDATVTLTANQTYVIVADGIVSPTGYTPNQDFGLAIYAQGREAATNASNTDVLVHHG
ncbi:DUF4397 domain-containing protein, partial [Flavobacterium sp. CYK-4]|uniref:DUF4397 domain-containing protein n=1 Tax=Flavobacterium lotistagni TaxID=2709660 RepID=UPI00140D2BC6